MNNEPKPEDQARWDVDTLINAQQILSDAKRVKYAKIEIKKRNTAVDKVDKQLETKVGKKLGETFKND